MDWTQQRLAVELGITQGHLSKVLRGLVPGSARLAKKLDGIGSVPPGGIQEPWLELVREAGNQSREARAAIEAVARVIRRLR